MTSEVNLAELLDIAAKEFDKVNNTIDEVGLESEWHALCSRLREAFENWPKEIEPNEETIRPPTIEARTTVLPNPAESRWLSNPIALPMVLPERTWRRLWLQRKFAA